MIEAAFAITLAAALINAAIKTSKQP